MGVHNRRKQSWFLAEGSVRLIWFYCCIATVLWTSRKVLGTLDKTIRLCSLAIDGFQLDLTRQHLSAILWTRRWRTACRGRDSEALTMPKGTATRKQKQHSTRPSWKGTDTMRRFCRPVALRAKRDVEKGRTTVESGRLTKWGLR